MTFCPQCGKPVAPTDPFCTACGKEVVHAPVTPGAPAAPTAPARRPAGLGIIGGVMIVLGGFILLVFGGGILLATSDPTSWDPIVAEVSKQTETPESEVRPLIWGILVGGLVMAIIAVITGLGTLRAKRWAWPLMIGFMVLNALGSVLSITSASGILGIVVSAIVIWYFLRPEVKAYFGRG